MAKRKSNRRRRSGRGRARYARRSLKNYSFAMPSSSHMSLFGWATALAVGYVAWKMSTPGDPSATIGAGAVLSGYENRANAARGRYATDVQRGAVQLGGFEQRQRIHAAASSLSDIGFGLYHHPREGPQLVEGPTVIAEQPPLVRKLQRLVGARAAHPFVAEVTFRVPRAIGLWKGHKSTSVLY